MLLKMKTSNSFVGLHCKTGLLKKKTYCVQRGHWTNIFLKLSMTTPRLCSNSSDPHECICEIKIYFAPMCNLFTTVTNQRPMGSQQAGTSTATVPFHYCSSGTKGGVLLMQNHKKAQRNPASGLAGSHWSFCMGHRIQHHDQLRIHI